MTQNVMVSYNSVRDLPWPQTEVVDTPVCGLGEVCEHVEFEIPSITNISLTCVKKRIFHVGVE